MITIRQSSERGHFDHGWLDTYHSFSFARYYDAQHMGFRSLRVINEDRVAGGRGFGMHPHDNMEILTLVLEGALGHKDTLGNGSQIRPGDVQRMSAGTGLAHAEYNASDVEPVHLFQIWMLPNTQNVAPSYDQKHFEPADKRNRLRLVASQSGRDASISIHQDADLYESLLEADTTLTHDLRPGRGAWLQVARGDVSINGQALQAGDGAQIEDESTLEFFTQHGAEFLLFDLA